MIEFEEYRLIANPVLKISVCAMPIKKVLYRANNRSRYMSYLKVTAG